MISIVTLLIWIHFSVRVMAAIACTRVLCQVKISCCKQTAYTVRIYDICLIPYMISYHV